MMKTAGLSAACLAALLATTWAIASWISFGNSVPNADHAVLDAMRTLRTPASSAAVTAVTSFTNLGRTVPMLIIGTILTTALFVTYRRRSIWVLMLVGMIGAVTLTNLLKVSFARPRPPFADAVPPFEPEFSFPSGHTLNSVMLAGLLAYLTGWLTRKAWLRVVVVLLALTWSLAMSASRVYLGHHWLTDVLGAWSLGLALLTVLIGTHQLILSWPTSHRLAPSATNTGQ